MIEVPTMTSFTQILTACEPVAWTIGLASLAVYIPAWCRYKHMLDDAAVKRLEHFDGAGLTRYQYRKAIDYYARAENTGNGSIFKNTYRWIRHPIASYRNARHAWREMKHELADIMPRGLRFLAFQEFFNIIGSTALEFSAAFLYAHLGGDFADALVFTIPIGSILAHTRRVHVGLFTRRRLQIIRNGVNSKKSISLGVQVEKSLVLDENPSMTI